MDKQTNGLGLAGFIVSLFGLLTCGTLSPIGFLLSVIGVFKSPRGFAIAGSILGALGSVWLAVAGLAMLGALAAPAIEQTRDTIQREAQKAEP